MRPYLWSPWETAAADPGRIAVIADEESVTFGELVAQADAFGRGLRALGLADGAVVATDVPTGPTFFALALAALRHGYGLFPVHPRLFDSAVAAGLLSALAAAVHVSDRAPAGLPCPVVRPDRLAHAGAGAPGAPGASTPPRAGYLAFTTSGTTGDPQAVARARPPRSYKGVAVDPRSGAGPDRGAHLMANPTYHLGTLGPALYALQAGSAVVVQRDWSPERFAELVDRHRADSAFLSPDRLLEVVQAGIAPRHRPAVVFHGGDACPPMVKREAIELLGPVLHEYYGTSQSVITEITTEEWLRHPGSVGRPLPGIRVEILRDGRPVAAGELGEITVRLRAADEGAVVPTGDVGFLDPEGYLSVIGRAERPELLDRARLEHEIRLLPGVSDAAVLAGPESVCFVETRRGLEADPAPAVRAAAARLGLGVPAVLCHPAGTLPRTPSGKIRRAALAAPAPAPAPAPAAAAGAGDIG
ncbi:class I adenylate-forming enzyme family protein [Streptomyces sp. ISL-86]|uniref:class I adenylate-forming enzyme family protein n=1 Tax=Streptomyces sp. ISL-86 TaxID=2819187 RepID=UPI001BEB0F78|nr:AMP-binding protein [Streptomyces sp. ISL-86]MBT2453668.1 AMP-binding protein [Streptomyces sp. ISL-86]